MAKKQIVMSKRNLFGYRVHNFNLQMYSLWNACHSCSCKSLYTVSHSFKNQASINMRLAMFESVVLTAGLVSVVMASLTTMFLVSLEIPDRFKVKKLTIFIMPAPLFRGYL